MKNKKFQYVISKIRKGLLNAQYPLKSGFLLIEIMAALIAFAGLAVLVARYQVSTMRQGKEARSYLQAVNVGSDSLEGSGTEKKIGQFRVERTVSDFIVPSQLKDRGFTTERLKKFKTVAVKVSWTAMDGQSKSIRLQSAGAMEAV